MSHCRNCGNELIPGENWTASAERMWQYTCRECVSLEGKALRLDEGYRKHQLERRLRRKYGLTLADYEEMLAGQGGVCAICGTDDPGGRHGRFNIDHDHASGEVRGLLCTSCNHGLGKFQDSPDLLEEAAAYLRDWEL